METNTSKDNTWLQEGAAWWRENGPPPWATAALIGAPVFLGGRLLWKPVTNTLASLFRPMGLKMAGGGENGENNEQAGLVYDYAVNKLQNDKELQWTLPAIAGVGSAALAALAFANKDKPYYGLNKWGSAMSKRAAFYMDNDPGYEQALDFDRPVNAYSAVSLFTDDPYISQDPYLMNMGTSIVSNAAISNHTTRPTLGGIFDSAVQKIDSKLSIGGLVDVGARTVVANGLARLFTGALGTMCDLSDNTKENIISAGTWAGAVSAILR